MAIGTPMIRATDVAQAYAQDLSPLTGLANQAQRQFEVQQARRQERDAQSAALLTSEMESLNTPTGTPFDDYVNGQTGAILGGYRDFMRKNPNASILAQKEYMYGQTSRLKNQMAMAKMLDRNIETTSAYLEKQYPTLDPVKLREAIKRAAWYNSDGTLKAPDKAALDAYTAGLSDDDNFRKVIDPTTLGATMVANFDKLYPEQGQNIPVKGTAYYWDADLRPYENFDVSTGKRTIPTENVRVGDAQIPALPENLYKSFSESNREFKLSVLNRADRLREEYPALRGEKPETVNRIAAGIVMDEVSVKGSKKAPVKKISEEAKWNLTIQKAAEASQHRRTMEGIAQQRLQLSVNRSTGGSQRPAIGGKNYTTANYVVDVMSDKPEAMKLAKMTTITRMSDKGQLNFSSIGIPQSIPVVDITASLKDGYFKAGNDLRQRIYKNTQTGGLMVENLRKNSRGEYVHDKWKDLDIQESVKYLKEVLPKMPQKIKFDIRNNRGLDHITPDNDVVDPGLEEIYLNALTR